MLVKHFSATETAFTGKIKMKNLASDDNESASTRDNGEIPDKFSLHFNRQQYCQYRDDLLKLKLSYIVTTERLFRPLLRICFSPEETGWGDRSPKNIAKDKAEGTFYSWHRL